MRIRHISSLALTLSMTACSNEAKPPPQPAATAMGAAPAAAAAPTGATAPCNPNQSEAAGLACAVFLALKANDAPGFVRLFMLDWEDQVAFARFSAHLSPPPDNSRQAEQRAAVERLFAEFLGKLRARGVDPTTMEIVEIRVEATLLRGDVGVAEPIHVVVLSGSKDMPIEISIGIATSAFVRGRWLVLDADRLWIVDNEEDGARDDSRRESPTPPAPTASTVVQGAAKIQGPLDKEMIRRIVRAHIRELHACHADGLVRDPTLGGRVVIDFKILATGKVGESTVRESTLADAAVGACMAAAARRWTFPKPNRRGATVMVSYPFELSPADSPAASP